MNTILAKDLLKTKRILSIPIDATLKQALSKLTSTHDAVFVFDGKKYSGIINPYYTVFKSSYPPDTKLSRCVYKPPQITPQTSLWDIARLMIESKIYYLPVLANHTFHGIVTARRVLKTLLKNKELFRQLALQSKRSLITIPHDSTVSECYNLIREQQVSRLPVVNANGRLVGIVSRYDIQTVLSEPKQKPRFMSRKGEKERQLDHPLDGYIQKMVITASGKASVFDLVEKIVQKNIGSVVITDRNNRPVDIVSTHDILKAIVHARPRKGSELEVTVDRDFIHTVHLEEILDRTSRKLAKRYPIKHIHFTVKTKKNPAGKINGFTTTAIVRFTSKQKPLTAHSSDFDWKRAVHETLEKLQNQLS